MASEGVEITADIVRETDGTYLVNDGDNDIWIPKSQIYDFVMVSGRTAEFSIPEWLAKDKGLI